MICLKKFAFCKLRNECGGRIAVAVDISDCEITCVFYDLELERRYARSAVFGTEIKVDNIKELVVKLMTSSMRELNVSSNYVKCVGIAASCVISTFLENSLTPTDLFLNPEIDICYVPFISAMIGGRFTATLLTLPAEECVAADFGKTICVAEIKGGVVRCAAFPLLGAFDGTGYESGMPSEEGAIDNLRCESDGTLVYEVIGDCDSIGISPCGAAAALSVMLDRGIIDSDGIMTDRDLFAIGEDFFISQNDVRTFQSDKARANALLSVISDCRKAYFSGEVFSSENGYRLMKELCAIPINYNAAFCRNSVEQGIILFLTDEKARERAADISINALEISDIIYSECDEKYYEQIVFEKKCEN